MVQQLEETSLSPFRFSDQHPAEDFTAIAGQVARGPEETREAALARIFHHLENGDDGQERLCRIARAGVSAGVLPESIVRQCQRIDEFAPHGKFLRLVEVIRVAMAMLSPRALKALGEELNPITEDERPPMQFSVIDGQPRRPRLPTRDEGRRIVAAQLAATRHKRPRYR